MKKLFLISAIFLSAAFYKAEAQVNVNINIGNQPVWGPVGYDYVDYYYLPDMDVYYSVPLQQFVYFDFGRWIFAASLPSRFGRYDLYNCYKVVINERDPWLRNTYYHNQYYGYRGRPQIIIRDSREPKYFVIRDHPQHNIYLNNQRGYNNQVRNEVIYDHRNERHEERRENYSNANNNNNYNRPYNNNVQQNNRVENNNNNSYRNNHSDNRQNNNRGDNRRRNR